MGLFFYNKIGSIISIVDLPTTNIIEPFFVLFTQALKTNSELLLHQPLTVPLIGQLSQIWSYHECDQANKP